LTVEMDYAILNLRK